MARIIDRIYSLLESRELRDIPNVDGYQFTGIDKAGEKHNCAVQKRDGSYYMQSDTTTFKNLVWWTPREIT